MERLYLVMPVELQLLTKSRATPGVMLLRENATEEVKQRTKRFLESCHGIDYEINEIQIIKKEVLK